MTRAEVIARLRELARDVIRTANRMLAMVADGAEPIGIADPEVWHVKRAYARRILAAINSDGYVDPRWLDSIARAAAGQRHHVTDGGELSS